MDKKFYYILPLLITTFFFGCRNTPGIDQGVSFDSATQVIQCEESSEYYSFLSPNRLSNGTTFATVNPDGPSGPIGLGAEHPWLHINPEAVNQSGLIHLNYQFGYYSPSPSEFDLIHSATIYHMTDPTQSQPSGSVATPICFPSPYDGTENNEGACSYQLDLSEIGVEQVFKSVVIFNDSTPPKVAWGYITAPGVGMGLPFAEIASFETVTDHETLNNQVEVSFDWVENNGMYGKIVRLGLYNETTGTNVNVYHSYGDFLSNGSTILDLLSSNLLVDENPALGLNTYHLSTYYWSSGDETIKDTQVYEVSTNTSGVDLPWAKIVDVHFNVQTLQSTVDIDIIQGDVDISVIHSVTVENETTNQTLCTVSSNFSTLSSCVDTPLVNQENTYTITTTYISSANAQDHEFTYFHSPAMVPVDIDNPELGALPQAKIIHVAFDQQTEQGMLEIDFIGDNDYSSIQSVTIKNTTTNQALCTFLSSFSILSSCLDEAPALGQTNEYKITTTYLSPFNTPNYIFHYYHAYGGDSNDGGDNDGGTDNGNHSKDIIELTIEKAEDVTLNWNILDFDNHDQISTIAVGKFEGNGGFQLSEQLTPAVTETKDMSWKTNVKTRYMLNVSYEDNEETLYTCEEITF